MITVAKKKKLHVSQPFIGYLFKNDFSFIFDIIYVGKLNFSSILNKKTLLYIFRKGKLLVLKD